MQHTAEFLFAIGSILLLGLATDYLGRHTFLPRVTTLILLGVLIGQEVLDLIPVVVIDRFELITEIALLMIGFLLGGQFTRDSLQRLGSPLLWISASASIVTTIVVVLGLLFFGVKLEIAILLGCIAAATAPAAIYDVVAELSTRNLFSRLLLSIVAIDDAWALIMFSLGVAVVTAINGSGDAVFPIIIAVKDVGGAIVLGLLLGMPAAYLTGRIRTGQPMLTEALGLVFICGGLALWMDVSYIISAMVMGAVIANIARHHEYPFHEINNIEWPFMVIFFVLAGASLEFDSLKALGFIGFIYILCRVIGKIIGAWIGSRLSHSGQLIRRWMGVALLPQAGVAIGMALVAAQKFPEYRQTILVVVIGSTVVFEVIGPLLTRMALQRSKSL